MQTTLTTNYGLAGGMLDVNKYVIMLRPGPDGYVNMDAYNRQAPWSGENGTRNSA